MGNDETGGECLLGVLDAGHAGSPSARELADRMGLPLLLERPNVAGLMLHFGREGLSLIDTAARGPGPVRVDFAERRLQHRLRHATPSREALARAVGLPGQPGLQVLDTTGGLGMDAFVLAGLGAHVSVLERHPVIYELLRDGLRRALSDPRTAEAAARIALLRRDARAHFAELEKPPEALYLDPMYPAGTKGGEVKKGMRSLQRLLGPDAAEESLFEAAWSCRPRRLVIKRPRRAGVYRPGQRKFALEGRHTRFDVYLVAEASAASDTT
ncbi:class I SAM-dependent methyltransferase [Ectothiorhodospiraceae bacterium WFHF3C12]|nr:class I SAM-dependent methyltransferase [Ectothiorhodospiraceae bacterium WFHF3C12]